MSLITIKGIVGFCGINEESNKENMKLYMNDITSLSNLVKNIQTIEKRAESPIKEIDRSKLRLKDLPEEYKYQINLKNNVGDIVYFSADRSPISVREVKSGDEVQAQVQIILTDFKGKKYVSPFTLKVAKIHSGKYEFLRFSPEEIADADNEFFSSLSNSVPSDMEDASETVL